MHICFTKIDLSINKKENNDTAKSGVVTRPLLLRTLYPETVL